MSVVGEEEDTAVDGRGGDVASSPSRRRREDEAGSEKVIVHGLTIC